jgi:hypothetical protein
VGLNSLKSLNLTNGYPNKNKNNNKNKNKNKNNKVKSKPLELRSRVKIGGARPAGLGSVRECTNSSRRLSQIIM